MNRVLQGVVLVLLEVRTTRVALSERAVFPFSVSYPTVASGDNAGRDPKDPVLTNGTRRPKPF